LNERIKDVSEQMMEDYNEKLRVIEEEKVAADMKNSDLESRLRAVQKELKETKSELFDAVNGHQENKAAKSEEVEMLMNDLEESNQRAVAAEKESEMLRERLDILKQEASLEKEKHEDQSDVFTPDLSRELSAKEREVQQLMTDIQQLKSDRKKENEEADLKLSKQGAQILELTSQIQQLETKLKSQADYEAIKKDLTILKSLEFPQESGEDSKRPLEVMILERSKVLQSDNTSLRVEKDRIAEELYQVKRELTDKNREVDRQQLLIAELENHVEQLQELSNSNRGEAEGRSSADILVDLTGGVREPSHSPDPENESSKALLPIVQAQRERFRQRNEELEDQQSKMTQQMTLLQSEVKDLQADNVKLYEKIRFLQGFGGNRGNNADSAIIPVESRYKSQYEQKMDPFATFSHQERQKRYGQLNVFEKIILSMVRFMMANKLARLFVFAYSVLLHLLVFAVLMRMAYTEAHNRDMAAEWHDRYMQHMENEHGHTRLT
jgi:homeobox protein cut-like